MPCLPGKLAGFHQQMGIQLEPTRQDSSERKSAEGDLSERKMEIR